MDINDCKLLSVSDARIRCSVVPTGLFLLIFPSSFCWLMVHIFSEAGTRCGHNLVVVHHGLCSWCVLSVFPTASFASSVQIFSTSISFHPHFLACLFFSYFISTPQLLIIWMLRKDNKHKLDEELKNSLKATLRLKVEVRKLLILLFLVWPLTID